MASLIRSARIAAQHRLLGGGDGKGEAEGSDSKDGTVATESIAETKQNKTDEKQQISIEFVKKLEADLQALAQVNREQESELKQTKDKLVQTETEMQRLLGDIEALRQDAVETARESGYTTGYDEGQAQLKLQGQRLEEIIQKFNQSRKDAFDLAEDEIVEVVFASVSKILGEAFVSADSVIASVKQAIKQLICRDRLVIHLSPKDKRLVEEAVAGDTEEIFGTAAEITADERVELGGCIIQTRTAGLDARLEIQLQQLRDCLLGVASRQESER